MTRSIVAVVAAAIAAGSLVAPAGAATPQETHVGTGAGAVWVLRPPGTVRSVVVFAHGWKHGPPATRDAWVAQFRPWLDHLSANGSAIVFPRYQLGGDSSGPERVASFRRGVALGLAQLRAPGVPVVAVGYSYGGSLVFAYAAHAQAWRLPPPVAVDSVFPAPPVAGSPLPPLHGRLEVLIQVGDRDTVAGTAGATAFLAWLRGRVRPAPRLEVVRSTASLAALHAAPKSSAPAARRAFWVPLDRLVARARP